MVEWDQLPPVMQHALYSMDWSVVAAHRDAHTIAGAFNAWCRRPVRKDSLSLPFSFVFDVGMLLTGQTTWFSIPAERGSDRRSSGVIQEYIGWLERLSRMKFLAEIHGLMQGLQVDADRQKRNDIVWHFLLDLFKKPATDEAADPDHRQTGWAFSGEENNIDLRACGGQYEIRGRDRVVGTLPEDYTAWPVPQRIDGENSRIEQFLQRLPGSFPEARVARLLFLCRATTSMARVVNFLDHSLVDECAAYESLKQRRRHLIRTVPTRRQLTDKPCTIEGIYPGVTKVERKSELDPVEHLLPETFARWAVDEAVGLDHILNRNPLVIKHESPEHIVPDRKVLVCFILDIGGDRQAIEQGVSMAPSTLSEALAFAMIWDAAERVPRQEMAVDVALFQYPPRVNDAAHWPRFPLLTLPPDGDNDRRLAIFDTQVPGFFYSEGYRSASGASDWDADPYAFLAEELMGPRYHSIYAVAMCTPERFGDVLCQGRALMRQRGRYRDGVLVVGLDCSRIRHHRAGAFRNLQEAAAAVRDNGVYLDSLCQEGVRELFLETIIGKTALKRRLRQDLVLVES